VPRLEVHGRGSETWLHHAKIVLASELETPVPLSALPVAESAAAAATRTRFTAGSGNMSANGTTLH
jgi:hypothetical protein